MLSLDSIQIKNVGAYKDVVLDDISSRPLTLILGRNEDSSIPDNKNGCGKSLLFTTLSCMRYEASATALTKKDKGSFLGAKGSATIRFRSHTDELIEVTQTPKKYIVTVDGKDQKVDRQDVARGIIEKHFPISQAEFHSFVYLSSAVPHPFHRSKPADRMKFLTDVFQLDLYDKLRAQFLKELQKCKDAEQQVTIKASALMSITDKLKTIRIDPKDEKKAIKAQARSELVLKQESELNAESRRLSVQLDSARKYEKVAKQFNELPKSVRVLDLSKERKRLTSEIDLAKRHAEYVEAIAEYKDTHKRLSRKLKKLTKVLGQAPSLSSIAKKFEALAAEESELEDDIKKLSTDLADVTQLADDVEALRKKLKKCEAPSVAEDAVDYIENCSKEFIRIFNKLRAHDHDSNCPTCNSPLDMKTIKKKAKKAEADLDMCESARAYYEIKQALSEAKKELKACKDPEAIQAKLDAKKKSLKSIGKKLDSLKEQYALVEDYNEIKSELKSLKKPKKVKPASDSIKRLKSELSVVETAKTISDQLEVLKKPKKPSSELKTLLSQAEKEADSLRQVALKLSAFLSDYTTKKGQVDVLQEQAAKLQAEIDELKPVVSQRRVAECLYQAYGSKHLKRNAVDRVVRLLEQKMNEFSHLVFPEPMTFKFETTSQGVSAYMARHGTKNFIDITNTLSGAESNCFRNLFAISMLPFIPESRRPSFIILDEPENSCSPAVRELLIKEFLPLLQDIVPNVIWITPQDDDIFGDAPRITVVKRNGVATLEFA